MINNEFIRNVIILDLDNSSLFHFDNYESSFLILSGGPTYGIDRSFELLEKEV